MKTSNHFYTGLGNTDQNIFLVLSEHLASKGEKTGELFFKYHSIRHPLETNETVSMP